MSAAQDDDSDETRTLSSSSHNEQEEDDNIQEPPSTMNVQKAKANDKGLRAIRRGSQRIPSSRDLGSFSNLAGAQSYVETFKRKAEEARKRVADRKFRAQFAFSSYDNNQTHVWVKDQVKAYIPARVLEEEDEKHTKVEMGMNREIKVIPNSSIGPEITRIQNLQTHYDDMVKMEDVNEATILHNLRLRFHEDEIYTNIGSILVSINPFKWLDGIYTHEKVVSHLEVNPGELQHPHIFMIASDAFRGVQRERRNQSVVISGESGAGKTEATKKCLQFFAEAARVLAEQVPGGQVEDLKMHEKLLSANPLLEGFGNAKTVRNDNSSRFGKWMEVHFDRHVQICGCKIVNYLLEKSRVVYQVSGWTSIRV